MEEYCKKRGISIKLVYKNTARKDGQFYKQKDAHRETAILHFVGQKHVKVLAVRT